MESSATPPPTIADASKQRQAVVVVDMVESVRLIQADEAGTISRWRRFVAEVRQNLLPRWQSGRLVKSLGDGLLLAFEDTQHALDFAFSLQAVTAPLNQGIPIDLRIALRTGVHVCNVFVDDLDIYGAGVNLAARVASLARPGEVVVSAAVRDAVLPGVDVDIEDLGNCYLKHVQGTVRAFRIRLPGPPPEHPAPLRATQPTVLVMPPMQVGSAFSLPGLDTVLLEQLVRQLGGCGLWHVISSLSSMALRDRALPQPKLDQWTGADYLVRPTIHHADGRLTVALELAQTVEGEALWYQRYVINCGELLAGEAPFLFDAARAIGRTILGVELQRAQHLSLPTLRAYSILFQAIDLLHRTSVDSVAEAQNGLDYLIDRHPREPEPHAWAARAHVLRVAQDQRADAALQARRARDHIRRALDIQPGHVLATTIEGLVCMFIERDLEGALASYAQAIDTNPNEALAWMFATSVHAHRGDGRAALDAALHARTLMPLHPHGHYLDGVTAWAMIAAGDPEGAESYALRAIRSDCTHRPTYLTLTQALALQGKLQQARETAARLMALQPEFSVSSYLKRYPGGASDFARSLGDALRAAGVPA